MNAASDHPVHRDPERRDSRVLSTFIGRQIVEERVRQIHDEGHDTLKDDGWVEDELALAASVYADPSPETEPSGGGRQTPVKWPWRPEYYKPTDDRRTQLIKAAALLMAEIERLDRRKT